MTTGQYDAAVIQLGSRRGPLLLAGQLGPFHQCAAAGRAPVALHLRSITA